MMLSCQTGLNLEIMTTLCSDRGRNLLFALVHVGAIVVAVNILVRNSFDCLTRLPNIENQENEDIRRPKSVFNQRRLFHFLSKAASLEPLHPVNKSCSKIKRWMNNLREKCHLDYLL